MLSRIEGNRKKYTKSSNLCNSKCVFLYYIYYIIPTKPPKIYRFAYHVQCTWCTIYHSEANKYTKNN